MCKVVNIFLSIWLFDDESKFCWFLLPQIKCLAQGHNTVTPVSLKLPTLKLIPCLAPLRFTGEVINNYWHDCAMTDLGPKFLLRSSYPNIDEHYYDRLTNIPRLNWFQVWCSNQYTNHPSFFVRKKCSMNTILNGPREETWLCCMPTTMVQTILSLA